AGDPGPGRGLGLGLPRPRGVVSSSRPFVPGPEHHEIVFLTGSGISARTGLGTFRGPDGLWALDPEIESAMHADRLPESLPDLWRVWGRMAGIALEKGPTPGHRAIARLGAPVITQNIDGLHPAAGSEIVPELHGHALHAGRLPESLPDLWRVWGRMAGIALEKGPTPGHRAIARLGAPVITQNIDGLHQAAGSEIVAELHGTALDAICLDPQCRWRAR